MTREGENMQDATIVIPNYNGKQFLETCLDALKDEDCPILLVDNGSADGSIELLREEYPKVRLLPLDKNYGFCRAVNEGIRSCSTKYVILLNNDTRVKKGFAAALIGAMEREPGCFSCQAKMLQMDCPDRIDDAGDFYCALGWGIARGKGQPAGAFGRPGRIFSACAGAAIYRRSAFEKLGYFDEKHFAYLEDVDIGWRARIAGYQNRYEPRAVVFHKGSGASGSRYNDFKVYHSARNNLYMLHKNLPLWQFLLNLPFLLAGVLIKAVFFAGKGLGRSYARGLRDGALLALGGKKTRLFCGRATNCFRIQLELWRNLGMLGRKERGQRK